MYSYTNELYYRDCWKHIAEHGVVAPVVSHYVVAGHTVHPDLGALSALAVLASGEGHVRRRHRDLETMGLDYRSMRRFVGSEPPIKGAASNRRWAFQFDESLVYNVIGSDLADCAVSASR